ncbi:SH3 domain-containing protein 19 isoform X2 [Engraulis encrasicolus]|uniref:SH3 domain-containing protein 19 isoform X2 n=1 Tax=Engraulis encrasicolus TaxID=184585 RepID=UPI002FCEC340
MAESRCEEEWREANFIRNRNQATDRSQRSKPDHIQPSSRPLTSIRPAFKRAPGRLPPQSHNTRDTSRQITILTAQPLASWFPAEGFTPDLPSSQLVWGAADIPVADKPPPSYDQVIQEKTQEQVVAPTPPPRRSHTTTSATQTDSADSSPGHSTQSNIGEPSKLKRPPKPPRPPLFVKPNPVSRGSQLSSELSVNETHKEDTGCANIHPTSLSHGTTTNCPVKSLKAFHSFDLELSTSVDYSFSDNTAPDISSIDSSLPSTLLLKQRPRPVPCPRTKASKPVDTETKVQTPACMRDSGEVTQVVLEGSTDLAPSPYFKELLEVFSSDTSDHSVPKGCQSKRSDISENNFDEMSIHSRIQAFESHVTTNDHVVTPAPVPKPRNQQVKPPVVAPKPALVPRSSVKRQVDENHNDRGSEQVTSAQKPVVPSPAPRPLPPRKPSFQKQDSLLPSPKTAILPPSHPTLQTNHENFPPHEGKHIIKAPPPVLTKPSREALNNNNHNSTSLSSESPGAETPKFCIRTQEMDCSNSSTPGPTPLKVQGVEGSFSRAGISRKPTMIRVPSTTKDDFQDDLPPLPIQKPVGGPPSSSQKNSFRSQSQEFNESSDLQLPPRPAGGKVLPPRPPQAKVGPDRPPPPRKEASQCPLSVSSEVKGALSNKPQHQDHKSTKTSKKGPTLPPRPTPGHPLYNKYSKIPDEPSQNGMKVQALFDFIPESQGELRLSAGDVVCEVEQLDSEWYLGTLRGVTGYFPISYGKVVSAAPSPETNGKTLAAGLSRGPCCVARFTFEAEQCDELTFGEGDVIELQEYIGEEWARGKLGTHVGIFPLNFVDIIEDLPAPTTSNFGSTKIALPGLVSASPTMDPKLNQAEEEETEWAEALYDFTAENDDEVDFQQGDRILVTAHIDEEWCSGRVNNKEGFFPKAFVRFY